MCYRDLALHPQATLAFKKALALTPKDPAIHYQLGLVALEQGAYREAQTHFQDGLRLNPNHALILIALGRLYIEIKQNQTAITTLRKATQIDSAVWEGWYELGRAHMKEREWKFALSALERARLLVIYNTDIYIAMATCYIKSSKKVDARQMVNDILQHDPHNVEAIRLQKQL
jgi:cytochrome c-type biogenesis protein CcmH/NrfG